MKKTLFVAAKETRRPKRRSRSVEPGAHSHGGMRPRAATALVSLACLVASAAADPLATFRPPRGASDRAASLVPPPQLTADEARASLGATTREAARAGGSPREEEANERDDVAPMASADALTDAGLSADVSAAVAFARSSLDAYENDRRYAAVVHEAVDALERRVLEESNSALSPERAARDATLRVALVELRDELDRALRYGPASNPRAYPRGVGTLPPETYYGAVLRPARRRRDPPDPPGSASVRLFPRGLFGFRGEDDAFSSAETDDGYYDDDDGYYYDDDPYYPYDDLDSYDRFVREDRVAYADVGIVGGFMQALTFVYSSKHYDSPALIDDWMRCSTLARPCSISETLRRCTYEPKLSWYRERRSRVNAPLDWPYCAEDLAEVYEYCTDFERQSGVCDPRVARSRAVFERAREAEYARQTARNVRLGRRSRTRGVYYR